MGFGSPQIKQEGMTFSPDHPEVKPWKGYRKEFDKYFSEHSKLFYLLFPSRCKKIAIDAWDEALFVNAKKSQE